MAHPEAEDQLVAEGFELQHTQLLSRRRRFKRGEQRFAILDATIWMFDVLSKGLIDIDSFISFMGSGSSVLVDQLFRFDEVSHRECRVRH